MADARFLIGTNYFPLDRERQSWEEWYAHDPGPDFEAMAAMGMSLARVFFSWRLFEPQVGQYDDEVFERLDRLVAVAKRNGLLLIVTLFADDGVSELLDLQWRQGRGVVADDYMLQRATQVAQRVAQRYRGEESILAWDIVASDPAANFKSAERFATWFEAVVEALKEGGADQMITVGVDAEGLLERTGVRIDDKLGACGFRCANATTGSVAYVVGDPHVSTRATYLDPFLVKLARRGVPVIANEVGPATLADTPEREAAVLGLQLAGLFVNRAAAALTRRWRDLDADWRDPYSRGPFEAPVGLHYPDGGERPAAEELRVVADIVAAIDLDEYAWERERAAVVMPLERYGAEPSLNRLVAPRSVFAAYVAAKRAHLPTDVVLEGDPVEEYSLVIVPSAQRVDDATWADLTRFVDAGGTVLLSYGGGDVTQAFCELFGLEFMGDLGRRSELASKPGAETILGTIPALDVKVELPHFALVSASGAGVVTTDTKGNPLLTVHSRGQGRAVFCAAPMERALIEAARRDVPVAVRAFVSRLYTATGSLAGASGPYACDAHQVELGILHAKDGLSDIVVMLNHDPVDVDATLRSERAVTTVTDLLTGKAADLGTDTFTVPLRAGQVKALRLGLEERRHEA